MKIYIATHKSFSCPVQDEGNVFVPIQVGATNKTSLGYLTDDTGDNISIKNSEYCELTGLYWIWKNSKEDIVGLCHYRRYFVSYMGYIIKVLTGKNCYFLKEKRVRRILRTKDLIAYRFKVQRHKTIYQRFAEGHTIKDMDTIKASIAKLYPEYLEDFDYVMGHREFLYANMFIARKEVADAYCNWLFDVLFDAEKSIDTSSYDAYQKRVMGFISERIFEIWTRHNNIKVANCHVVNTDDSSVFKWIIMRH